MKTPAKPARRARASRRPGNAGASPSARKPKHPAAAAIPAKRRRPGATPDRVRAILGALAAAYPNAECALHHRSAWELLVATILSAQCTDVRVNLVTPELFRQYPTPQALAAAPLERIEELIRTTGFYHNKAASISGAAQKISREFGGQVPRRMEDLLTLPGVARKTANVVLGVAFQQAEGVVVDTHVQRLSGRLDLSRATDPKQIEADLMRVLPRDQWIAFSHRMIAHGRQICVARRPKCDACPLERLCYSQDKTFWSEAVADARPRHRQ